MPETKFADVTHVIFDLDGLIIDSESCYERGINNLTMRYGRPYDWNTKLKAMGRTARECAKVIVNELNLPITVDQYLQEIELEYDKMFEDLRFMGGAENLIKHLSKNSIPIAIATSSKNTTYKIKTEKFGDFFKTGKYFHHALLAYNDPHVKYGKPHPETFQVCAKRFAPPIPNPEQILVFEDSINGVKSAMSAGMQCVMVPDPRLNPSDMHVDTTLIIPSLLDFKPEIFGLPPFP